MDNKQVFFIFLRYALALFLGFFALDLIYLIFAPLTIYPSYFVLKMFYPSLELVIEYPVLVLSQDAVVLADACIAGAAYLLLFILNLISPMSFKTLLKSIIFTTFTFLLLNIIRIVVFSSLYFSGFTYFDIAHKLVWYLGSTLLVVLIWFSSVKIFKISSIPGYSDLNSFFSETFIKSKKVKRKSKSF